MMKERMAKLVVCIMIVFACVGQSQADTLYYDDFSGAGTSSLNGTMPDVGANAWTAPSGWTDDGHISGYKLGAYLPFVPEAGKQYVLSGTMNSTGTAGWAAVGFADVLTTSGALSQTTMNGTGWFLKNGTGSVQTYMGRTGGSSTYTDTPGIRDFKIVLDTRPTNWTVEWFLAPAGNPLVSIRGPVAWTTNPSIKCIMLNTYNGVADIDELSLTRIDLLGVHDPITGETNVEFNLSARDVPYAVSWQAPTDPEVVTIYGYDVYMDTVQNNVINATAAAPGTLYYSIDQTGTSFAPGVTLDLGETYYWRVDAVVDLASVPGTGPDVVRGSVWSFSTWAPDGSLVDIDPAGNLFYEPDANGNVIPDFSMVGYHQGNKAIPNVPVKVTLSPSTGDRTADIQNAIDTVSALPRDANGHRGAVLLQAGYYEITNTLNINASGVVIRGQGKGANGTVVEIVGTDPTKVVFQFIGSGGAVKNTSTEKQVTDSFVPIGAKSITVQSGHSFQPGDRVLLCHTSNTAWIAALGMDQLVSCGETNWGPFTVNYKRKVTAVAGNVITLDAPLVQPVDPTYNSSTLAKYTWPGKIEECGLENIRLLTSYASETDENHAMVAISFSQIENAWARDVEAYYFGGIGYNVSGGAYQVTVIDCGMYEYKSLITGGRRYGFFTDDSELILFKNCQTTEGRHDFVQDSLTGGPNVYTNCSSAGATADIGPHARYATGTLWDAIDTGTSGAINVQNRLCSGSGHGWAGAQQVIWNCITPKIILHNPPSDSVSWAIGCIANITNVGDFGAVEPLGVVESQNVPIADIPSLYEAQLNAKFNDTLCPTPNPATFSSAPSAVDDNRITMTSTIGSDATGPVEYYFACISGGGNDSGWQTSPSYTDTSLTGNTQYTYTVQMRDALGNTGTASSGASATTPQGDAIEYIQITDDDDCGIDYPDSYTHAIDFGSGTPSTVNNLQFVSNFGTPVTGGPSNSGSRTFGTLTHAGNTPPNVTGNIAGVFRDMIYSGPDGYLELTGLTPGQWYDVRLYERNYETYPTATSRTFIAKYDVDSDGSVEYTSPVINTNNSAASPIYLPGGSSFVISYVYQAGNTGKIKINIVQHVNLHLYGLTNNELDIDAPTPNPATFSSAPSAYSSSGISMTATTGTDASGPVEYLFTCTAGGGNSSGWQTSPSYTDTGLTANTQYTYTVQMRDGLGNTGTASSGASATTLQIDVIDYIQITDDLDSGIHNIGSYTHAIDFGSGTPSTVNNLQFVSNFGTPVTGGPSNSGSRTFGTLTHAGNTPPNVTGNIAGVFTDFIYWGPDGYLELTGLTPGKWYDVRLYERNFETYPATGRTFIAKYDVDSDGFVEYTSPVIETNNSAASPMYLPGGSSFVISYVYQAGSTGKIKINIVQNVGLHLYGLTNNEVLPISYIQVTNDTDCGIDDPGSYTHAIDFGSGTPSTVNNLQFVSNFGTPVTGGPSNSGSRTFGTLTHAGNTPPNVTGNIAGVFRDMIYWGPDGYLELTGLTPGQWYDVRLYERNYETYPATGRTFIAEYDVDSDGFVEYTSPVIETNNSAASPMYLPGGSSFVISYVYQAGSTGKIKINIVQNVNLHLYGLTNNEI